MYRSVSMYFATEILSVAPIDQAAADTWMACMEASVSESAMPTEHRALFLERMRLTAQAMINRTSEDGSSHPM